MQKRAWRSVCLSEMHPRQSHSATVAEEKILTRAIAEAALAEKDEEVASRHMGEEVNFAFSVSLQDYTRIEDGAAEIIGKCGYGLDLGGLSAISVPAAWSLGAQAGVKLVLNGLTALEPAAALGLAGYGGDLELNGLKDLPEEVARGLAQFRGENLSLGGTGAGCSSAVCARHPMWPRRRWRGRRVHPSCATSAKSAGGACANSPNYPTSRPISSPARKASWICPVLRTSPSPPRGRWRPSLLARSI